MHFLEWKCMNFTLKISLMFVRINNVPALVQIMAWHQSGNKPLSRPMMVSLLMHMCVTWPQWDKKKMAVSLQHNFSPNPSQQTSLTNVGAPSGLSQTSWRLQQSAKGATCFWTSNIIYFSPWSIYPYCGILTSVICPQGFRWVKFVIIPLQQQYLWNIVTQPAVGCYNL